jgi:hypothetical protein
MRGDAEPIDHLAIATAQISVLATAAYDRQQASTDPSREVVG